MSEGGALRRISTPFQRRTRQNGSSKARKRQRQHRAAPQRALALAWQGPPPSTSLRTVRQALAHVRLVEHAPGLGREVQRADAPPAKLRARRSELVRAALAALRGSFAVVLEARVHASEESVHLKTAHRGRTAV